MPLDPLHDETTKSKDKKDLAAIKDDPNDIKVQLQNAEKTISEKDSKIKTLEQQFKSLRNVCDDRQQELLAFEELMVIWASSQIPSRR